MRPQGDPVHRRVFKILYPFAGAPTNPPSWSSFVKRCLEPEVKAERNRFYGQDDAQGTLEGRYPGFRYDYWPHRRRLEKWSHHRRLFIAMDELKLTTHDINQLCTWDGTLAQKERYERHHSVYIEDTTGLNAYHRMLCAQRSPLHDLCPECEVFEEPNEADIAGALSDPSHMAYTFDYLPHPDNQPVQSVQSLYHNNNEADLQSVGMVLNARLMAAAAAREQGDETATMDPEFEAWLKDMHEHGQAVTYPHIMELSSTLPSQIAWNDSI